MKGGQFSEESIAPDLTVPIVGFRGWHLNEQGQLKSTLAPVTWTKPTLRAECLEILGWGSSGNDHPAPDSECSCGIYSFYRPSHYAAVAGAVVLTGRMQIHTQGIRAAHARIVALCSTASVIYAGSETAERNARTVATIGEAWGLPVVKKEELESIALEFGERISEQYIEQARKLDLEAREQRTKELRAQREAGIKKSAQAAAGLGLAAMFAGWWFGGSNAD